ncbi:MAG TPA: hypothetical protein VHD63_14540, partial [Ktedonobacteraceae bacterium]|nr:hypothetical protein [Ktedonobacteraceae bacterium]
LTRLFADPDLLGWAYQFYQHEARAKINAKCRRGEKVVSRAELVAKTQIFTEEYIVDWLLQNSLGRCYREAYPRSSLPASWPLAFTPDESDGPPERVWSLEELTLLDPCMGCGHFLRAAFDLLVAMYREQYPHMSMMTLVERVFARHLFGIDLDAQAVQIGKLTLLLRAWELLSVEYGTPTLHVPPLMHLITIPSRLTPGSLARHLQRFPEDLPYQAYLEPIFTGLEQIDLLGSLLCLRTRLDAAAAETDSASHLPSGLLERLAASCAAEEMTARRNGLAGDQAGSLLHLLNGRYTVVATNPPYLDSRDMQETLRMYIAAHYQAGKRDLYTAFMLRCLDLCQPQGRLALVTMQSWMFNRSFAELRAGRGQQTDGRDFGGLLRAASLEALVHLGAHSFEEIAGQIVQCAMFVFRQRPPREDFRTRAWRLVGMKSAEEKRAALLKTGEQNTEHLQSRTRQGSFLALREAPLVYYLSDDLMRLLTENETLESIAHVRQGLATAENARFTRCFWEIAPDSSLRRRWFRYARG